MLEEFIFKQHTWPAQHVGQGSPIPGHHLLDLGRGDRGREPPEPPSLPAESALASCLSGP